MVAPAAVVWKTTKVAHDTFKSVWKSPPADTFIASRDALREVLCGYFSAGAGDCSTKLHSSISPMGGCGKNRKLLKVRWQIPGRGKSGGMRIAVVVDCTTATVWLAEAWVKKDEPSADEMMAAAGKVPG